jgi:choline dehydrogenase-like flavoprotein
MADFDCAIIGSGTAGGVLAHFLTEGGLKCLLLEAGQEYNVQTYPDSELEGTSELYWNGGMDISQDGRLVLLRAKCVGGGSVINQCLLDRFDQPAFSTWKNASGVSFFSEEAMAPHYESIESKLSIQKIPREHFNKNAEIFVRGFEALGFGWMPLTRGQTNCALELGNDCIGCLNGCHRDSKQSIPVVFLPKAMERGLEVRPGCFVERVVPEERQVRLLTRGQRGHAEITAKACVLAAGALGSTQLLLASGLQKDLPYLGQGFFCHPQTMIFGAFEEDVCAFKGAFQAAKSSDARLRAMGLKFENVFAPPASIAMLIPGYGKKHQGWMRRFKNLACMEVAIQDKNPGRLELQKNGTFSILKTLDQGDKKRLEEGKSIAKRALIASGAKEVFASKLVLGLHLMGGCAMGRDQSRSVVDEQFRVNGVQNLFIADSSIFPAAPGINPALTIMALAHRASQTLLEKRVW